MIFKRKAELNVKRKSARGGKAIVFVHGILSGDKTFAGMIDSFEQDLSFADWDLCTFRYRYWDKMELNATRLANCLKSVFENSQPEVTIVAHSMGGLVSRLALIQDTNSLRFVVRLIMLGTPNAGAMPSKSLSLLTGAVFHGARMLTGLFTRSTGIQDLTRAGRIFEQALSKETADLVHLATVEYVTIPGKFYHDDTTVYDSVTSLSSALLATPEMAGQLLAQMVFLGGWAMGRPHDGIVEEASVRMDNKEKNEKYGPLNDVTNGNVFKEAYSHIWHSQSEKLTHIDLQSDVTMIALVKGILSHGGARKFYMDQERRGLLLSPVNRYHIEPK